MTLSIVQSAVFEPVGTAASGTVTWAAPPTPGNLLLLFGFSNANGAESTALRPEWTTGASAANGGEWKCCAVRPGGLAQVTIWYRYAVSGEANSWLCRTSIGSSEQALALYEIGSSAGRACIVNADQKYTSTATSTHTWPAVEVDPGDLAIAIGWLSTSGGGSTWTSGSFTDGFTQHRRYENNRALIGTKAITVAGNATPTATSAASKESSEAVVVIAERGQRPPDVLQHGFAYTGTNDPTAVLTRTPTPGNILLMFGSGRLDYGSAPAGFAVLDTAIAPDGFSRVRAWWKIAGSGEATSYLLDTATSEFHMVNVFEIDLQGARPLLSSAINQSAASTTITSGTLPRAYGPTLWVCQQSSDGGLGVVAYNPTNRFSARTLCVNGSTNLPSCHLWGRNILSPEASVSTAVTKSASRSAAGIIVSLEWTPDIAMGRAFDGLAGQQVSKRRAGSGAVILG